MRIGPRSFRAGVPSSIHNVSTLRIGLSTIGLVTPPVQNQSGSQTIKSQVGLEIAMFANFLKGANHSPQPQLSLNYPALLNDDGYPLPTANLSDNAPLYGYAGSIPAGYEGNLVAFWTGQGGFLMEAGGSVPRVTIIEDLGGFTTGVNANFRMAGFGTMNGTTDRIIFKLNGGSAANAEFPIYFPSGYAYSQTTQMSKLVICRAQDEAICRADENAIFPPYLAMLQDLAPHTIRVMDILATNHSTRAQSKYDPAITNVCFGADNFVKAINVGDITGSTTANVDNYVCGSYSTMPTTWTDKEQFQGVVRFANPSDTATINVAGRGAKKLYQTGGFPFDKNGFYTATLATFVYDANLDGVIANVGGLPGVVPLPILVKLANTLNCDLWVNLSAFIDDASVTSIVSYCANNLLNRGIFEYSNEIWNFGYAFQQTFYAVNVAARQGVYKNANNGLMSFYHNQVKRIGTLLRAARGSNTKMKMALASQGYSSSGTNDILRFQGTSAGNGTTPVQVTGITNSTDPVVQTATPHGRSTNDYITIQGNTNSVYGPVTGMTVGEDGSGYGPINGVVFAVGTVIDSTHFKLKRVSQYNGSDATMSILSSAPDSTAYGTYTGGGYIFPCPVAPNRAVDVIDIISYAHYTSGNVLKNGNYYVPADMQTLYNKAQAYVMNGDTTSLDWLDADYRNGNGTNDGQTLMGLVNYMYPGWNFLASKYNLSIEAYEGGYEGASPNPDDWTNVGNNNSVPALVALGSQATTFTNDTFTKTGHGRVNGEPVTLTGTPPGFHSFANYGDFYWIVQATTNTFKLSKTKGGSAIISDDPTGNYTPKYSVGSGMVTAFMQAYKFDSRFYSSYLLHLTQFFQGNSNAPLVVPSQFALMGKGQWSVWDGPVLTNSPHQSYNAIKFLNHDIYTPTVTLSANSTITTAQVGDVIGALSVNKGNGTFVYTITTNPGNRYGVANGNLVVNGTLSAGTETITVRANNGAGGVYDASFNITTTLVIPTLSTLYKANDITVQATGTNGTASPWTASNVNIGPAYPTRRVIVFAFGGAGNTDVASATINGIAASTPVVVGSNVRVSIYSAIVPTGTTATIVQTMIGNFYGSSGIQIFVCDDSLLQSPIPVVTAANISSGTSISGSVNTIAGGFIAELLAFDAGGGRSSMTITASNPTQTLDYNPMGQVTVGHANNVPGGTATVSYSWGNAGNGTLAMAAFAPVSSVPTAYNTTDQTTYIQRSNNNLTLAWGSSNPGSGRRSVRSVASHSTGKYYREVTPAYAYTPCSISIYTSSGDVNNNPGNAGNLSMCYQADGQIVYNYSVVTNIAPWNVVDGSVRVVSEAVDLTNKLYWGRVNGGNWNNDATANPATGTGGISFAGFASGPYYAGMTFSNDGEQSTTNYGATPYVYTPPSGFKNW